MAATRRPVPPGPGPAGRRADGDRGWVLPGLPGSWARERQADPDGVADGGVRATVVLVVRNRADTVADSIRHLLGHLLATDEVVVVDDASTDATAARVDAMTDPRVRLVALAAPRGTAWATGLGLQHAWGRLLVVPEPGSSAAALADLVAPLLHTGALAAVADGPATGVDGRDRAAGVVGWRTAVLGRVGSVDPTVADPSRDLRDRVRAALVPAARVEVGPDGGLVPARDRGGRADLAGPPDPGAVAAAARDVAPPVDFPPRRDPVTVTLASIPRRRDHLARVVRTLLPQTDRLGVYLNDYDHVPAVLQHPRILVARSQDHGDLRDNGKFFFGPEIPDGYHVTVDDDIDYPPDHVAQLVAKVEQFDRRAVVGLHGVVVDEPVTAYFGDGARRVLHFRTALARDEPVHVLGSGTVAMHTDTLRLDLDALPTTGMADIWLAVAAHRAGVPLMAVSRPAGRLRPLADDGPTLFSEFHADDRAHVEALRSVHLDRGGVTRR